MSGGVTNNVEGCIKKPDEGGGGVKKDPKYHDVIHGWAPIILSSI